MAKQQRITLTLDFEVERAKLQQISSLLGTNIEKGLKGTTSKQFFGDISSAIKLTTKDATDLYKILGKPLVSKAQAKEVAGNLNSVLKGFDNKLLSLQGNLARVFNSSGNMEALKQIRELGTELDKLSADYQKVSQLISTSRGLGSKVELKSQLSAASKELDTLNKKQGQLTQQEVQRQQELQKIVQQINEQLAEKARIQEQINAIHESSGVTSQQELGNLIGDKVGEQTGLINGSISVKEAEKLREVLSTVRIIVQDILKTMNATIPKVDENIEKTREEARLAEEQSKSFKGAMKELGIPMLSLQSVARGMRRVIDYSYEYIKNLDKALTEISVVSGKTRAEVMELTDTFIELSARTGMAIDDIAQASTIFYQQGLNDEAVAKLTEYTAIFAKISNETVEVAADQITSAINGFNFSVDQAGEVIDKLSVLAAYSAADIDELATAMSKGASQANMAGLSFDQYNAYLATMIETTREAPENLGTSLKTIMSRFQNIQTGDNTEDDTDVNDVEKALKSVGVQLRDSEGQLRDLGDVLDELGPKWQHFDRNTQAYLGTVIAGTRWENCWRVQEAA